MSTTTTTTQQEINTEYGAARDAVQAARAAYDRDHGIGTAEALVAAERRLHDAAAAWDPRNHVHVCKDCTVENTFTQCPDCGGHYYFQFDASGTFYQCDNADCEPIAEVDVQTEWNEVTTHRLDNTDRQALMVITFTPCDED